MDYFVLRVHGKRGCWANDIRGAKRQRHPVQLVGALRGWATPTQLPNPGNEWFCKEILQLSALPRPPPSLSPPPSPAYVWGRDAPPSGTLCARDAWQAVLSVLANDGCTPPRETWAWGEALALACAPNVSEATQFILDALDATLRAVCTDIAACDAAVVARAGAVERAAARGSWDNEWAGRLESLLRDWLERTGKLVTLDAIEAP